MKNYIILFYFSFIAFTNVIGQVNFESISFDEAILKAEKEGKKVFIDVYTTWCGPCKSLDANIFSNKAIGDRMDKDYVCLKVDYENSPYRGQVANYYIKGYPTMLILDGKGFEIGRIYGNRNLANFNAELDQLKDKKLHPINDALVNMKTNPNDQTIWKQSLEIIGEDYNLINKHNLYQPYLDSCKRYFEKFDIRSIEDNVDLSILRQVTLPASHPAVQYYIKNSLDFGSYMHFGYTKESIREEIGKTNSKSEIEALKVRAAKYHEQVFLGMGGDLESLEYFMDDLFGKNQLEENEEEAVIEEDVEEIDNKSTKKKKSKKLKQK